jgi:hypothetical protein
VRLSYASRKREVERVITLEWTACTLGGARPWFRCAVTGCGRRCARIYLVGGEFACRTCQGLAYTSQREDRVQRLMRKADKISERLGGTVDEPRRPKGMHRRTFRRLVREAREAEAVVLLALARPG